jgi:Arc/MetJ family transcription regulator
MRTNIEIDEKLMDQVMKSLGTSTKRETVQVLLQKEYDLQQRLKNQSRLKQLRGIGWDEPSDAT